MGGAVPRQNYGRWVAPSFMQHFSDAADAAGADVAVATITRVPTIFAAVQRLLQPLLTATLLSLCACGLNFTLVRFSFHLLPEHFWHPIFRARASKTRLFSPSFPLAPCFLAFAFPYVGQIPVESSSQNENVRTHS